MLKSILFKWEVAQVYQFLTENLQRLDMNIFPAMEGLIKTYKVWDPVFLLFDPYGYYEMKKVRISSAASIVSIPFFIIWFPS